MKRDTTNLMTLATFMWAIKEEAKQIAKNLLESRFASTPTHSNPKVQVIIDELLKSKPIV
ncbi:MAG TPA: hypothetical protein VIO11_11475 [Candidatus Methanoperedens sp.]